MGLVIFCEEYNLLMSKYIVGLCILTTD